MPTDSEGPQTLIFKAVDLAGNEIREGCAYLVSAYKWAGFYAPVQNPPAINRATAGQSVPLKFSLGVDGGPEVIAAGYPVSRQIACGTREVLGPPSPVKPAGRSGLSYDGMSGRYTYVWKTDKAWAGTCRLFTLMLADTTRHEAVFQFK